MFDTGSNIWRSFEEWPPRESKTAALYLGPNHSLSFEPPKAAGHDTYESDPAHPVPFVADHGFDMDADYMAHDQRFASNRPDVLTYQTQPLREAVTVVGPITPQLVVATTGTDSDWVVKLIDIHPGSAKMRGFEELVRGDLMRGKFRDSFSAPTPMTPNAPTRIEFNMPDVYHTFKKGHRLQVEIQSSWFPLFDRNPQRFLDIYSAQPADFRKATQQVFYGPQHGSRIELPLLTSHP
jgi:putative CocE/NonD family hydrolase